MKPGLVIEVAQSLAEAQLAEVLPVRWAHICGVANQAMHVGQHLHANDEQSRVELQVAAWLHDIGYAPKVRTTGFHPLDGALWARKQGFSELIVSLIAHHTGAMFEATQRGLEGKLAAIAAPPISAAR